MAKKQQQSVELTHTLYVVSVIETKKFEELSKSKPAEYSKNMIKNSEEVVTCETLEQAMMVLYGYEKALMQTEQDLENRAFIAKHRVSREAYEMFGQDFTSMIKLDTMRKENVYEYNPQ